MNKEAKRWARSSKDSFGEFDPGSARTLAACLTHASRGAAGYYLRVVVLATGKRVSNT